MCDVARDKRADLPPVSSEGDAVRRRRERLGMHKGELAEAAGVNRDTLAAIEAGEGFRRVSLTKIERALDAAEEEAGLTAPPRPEETEPPTQAPTVVIRLGNGAVVVEGPVDNLEALIEAAERLRRSVMGPESDV